MKFSFKNIAAGLALGLLSAATASAQFTAPVVTVTGSVLNQLNREPAGVTVLFLDENGQRAGSSRSNTSDGYYLVTGLKAGKTYRVRLEGNEFFQMEQTITLPNTSRYAEVSRDFVVSPMATGTRIPLEIAPFEAKKGTLRPGADEILEDLREMLVMNPNVRVDIYTYPDEMKSRDENTRISRERANALRDYLVSKGVAASRLNLVPSAELDPLNPPPLRKTAKGKRYIGTTYVVVTSV
ncbi:MAG TPA: OmpA family protein [Patescibacteria group bacterium]|nr:OmpA family protein [Patescibacteria group bacterium]